MHGDTSTPGDGSSQQTGRGDDPLLSLPETFRREELVGILRPLLARIELLEAQVQELQASRYVHALKLGLLGQGFMATPGPILQASTTAQPVPVPEVPATASGPSGSSSSWLKDTVLSVIRPLSRSSSERASEKRGEEVSHGDYSIQVPQDSETAGFSRQEVTQTRFESRTPTENITLPGALQHSAHIGNKIPEYRLEESSDTISLETSGVRLLEAQKSSSQAADTSTSSRILTMISRPGKMVNSSSQSSDSPSLAVVEREETSEVNIRRARSSNSPGFFHKAERLTFNQPSMYDVQTQNVYVQGGRSGETLRSRITLQWLQEHSMHGAEFDSIERDPPPRCHPGTRTSILQKATDWLENSNRSKRLFWLRGPAGVGKSAIIQTLAERLYQRSRLGSSIFFSRPNGRTDPNQVFPTIAYQLAIQFPLYKEYISELMQKNPKALGKALSDQFRILIVEPFVQKRFRDGFQEDDFWVITLDGLDECGGDPDPGGRSSDQVQCKFVRMISKFVLTHSDAPFIWVIASRPETHLKVVFDDETVKPSFWEEDVPVNSDEACQDVEEYLHSEFERIRKEYPSHIEEKHWPSNIHFLRIATAASGLFIFAETVIRFIDSHTARNPVGQLDCVLSALQRTTATLDNPLAALDLIYTEILSRVPRDMLHVAKSLIGSLIFLERDNRKGDRRTFRDICNFLGVSKDRALTSLSHLHSVLHFSKDIGTAPPRFYHASFRDYLQDPTRSQEYAIAAQDVGIAFFLGSMRLTAAALGFKGVEPAWPVEGSSIGWTIDNAKDQFRAILTGDLSSGTGIGIKYFTTKFVIPDDHLQSFLESLNISKMVQIDTGGIWWPLDLNENMTAELQRRKFLTRISLGNLDLSREEIAKSFVYAHPHRHVLIHLDRKKPGPERLAEPDRAMVDTLLRCIQDAPETMVTLWGYMDPTKRCVVMKVEDLSGVWPVDGPRLHPFYITGL
ncbi:hypothetical protein NP233_g5913 [Leucocoprinus birnbaumii]|uniref:Nephrocystin 3-like N-terminal domain-containing protein n=1 Tax=Leucocoprinus birnbaumii TaxID=56174 RepID=A0AAD5YU48_9AGAR|nr:hypothetical protein NP233_g5913 [Leucocoprinus birnbaumii]